MCIILDLKTIHRCHTGAKLQSHAIEVVDDFKITKKKIITMYNTSLTTTMNWSKPGSQSRGKSGAQRQAQPLRWPGNLALGCCISSCHLETQSGGTAFSIEELIHQYLRAVLQVVLRNEGLPFTGDSSEVGKVLGMNKKTRQSCFFLKNAKLHRRYLRGQHLLYPWGRWVFHSNLMNTAFVQAFWTSLCQVDTKKNTLSLHFGC